jgi:hypothetical protein
VLIELAKTRQAAFPVLGENDAAAELAARGDVARKIDIGSARTEAYRTSSSRAASSSTQPKSTLDASSAAGG